MQIHNFSDILRGDTFNGALFVIDINDSPADLTGSRVDCWLREGSNVGAVRKKISTTTGGIVLTGPTNGEVTIKPFIANLPVGTYYYDLQIKFSSGKIKTYIGGSIAIIQDITG